MISTGYSKFFLACLLVLFGFNILVFKANAVSSSSILVEVSPENINPNDNVTITLSSYASNLDSVLILWSVDGRNALSGIGKKSFSLYAPASGKEKTVTATISLPDGDINKTITIKPAITTLLWQANDSYVPPFYKGKALPSMESEVKIVAIPEIKIGTTFADLKDMTYAWKQDYNNMQGESGYNKSYYIFTNDYLQDLSTVSVTATTIDQKYSSGAEITVGTYSPKINFYKKSDNMGIIWEHTLADKHQIKDSEIIFAAPYFISPKEVRIPVLTWDWSINDTSVGTDSFTKNLLPVKVQAGTSGIAKIKLEINNKYKIFQTTNKEINVNF